jgi:hypothetical protein
MSSQEGIAHPFRERRCISTSLATCPSPMSLSQSHANQTYPWEAAVEPLVSDLFFGHPETSRPCVSCARRSAMPEQLRPIRPTRISQELSTIQPNAIMVQSAHGTAATCRRTPVITRHASSLSTDLRTWCRAGSLNIMRLGARSTWGRTRSIGLNDALPGQGEPPWRRLRLASHNAVSTTCRGPSIHLPRRVAGLRSRS